MRKFKRLRGSERSSANLAKTTQLAGPADDPSLGSAILEHRQSALKKGRRHRKPVKKARHSVLLFTLSLILIFLVAYLASSFYILQKKQSYSNLAYNISKTVPYKVSHVDGEPVSYEEYLFILRQNLHYLIDFTGVGAERINVNTEDGKRIVEQKKAEALAKAEEFAFIQKKARELNLSVSDTEVQESINAILSQKENFTEAELEKTLQAHYGWSIKDYKRYHKMVLLERKVLSSLDKTADSRIKEAYANIQSGKDFLEVANSFSQGDSGESSGGSLGVVNTKSNSANLSSTVLYALKNLGEGQTSGILVSNDAFVIIKNVRSISDNEREVQIISLKFRPASSYLDELRDQGRISRSINPAPDSGSN